MTAAGITALDAETVQKLRALEAVRNGVPNRAAIEALGCPQPAIEQKFREALAHVPAEAERGRQVPGFVVSGDFGSGKSHLLGFLERIALEERMVCSRIVISKETPLYKLDRVFRSAIDAAVLPDARGSVMQELSARLDRRSPGYAELYARVNDEANGFWPGFAASMRLWEDPPEDAARAILDFWAGYPLPLTSLKGWLKAKNLASAFPVRRVGARELLHQHLEFAARLFRAAGYSGWVILIDEAELIARYGPLQRAQSYSELARWLGHSEASQTPGIVAVAAITEDFSLHVLEEKLDREHAAPRLRERGFELEAARAERGIKAIRQATALRPPDQAVLDASYVTLRRLHAEAYGWEPPELERPAARGTARMRQYVRRWTTEWDLARFYPEHEVEQTEVRLSYDEDPDLMSDSNGDRGELVDGDPLS